MTLLVEIIDGKRCHLLSSVSRNAALFSSTVGAPGLFLSHLVKTMVNGVSFSINQSAYVASFSEGGMLASTSNNTPAKFSLETKYSFVNASHASMVSL